MQRASRRVTTVFEQVVRHTAAALFAWISTSMAGRMQLTSMQRRDMPASAHSLPTGLRRGGQEATAVPQGLLAAETTCMIPSFRAAAGLHYGSLQAS